jgi:hypothetical protein
LPSSGVVLRKILIEAEVWRHNWTSPSSGVVLRKILIEAEVWRAAGLFKARLASVDRWRVGE